MRDAGDHLAERGHFLRLDQLRFGFLQMAQSLGQFARALDHAPLQAFVRALEPDAEIADADQQRRGVGEQVYAKQLLRLQRGFEFAVEREAHLVQARAGRQGPDLANSSSSAGLCLSSSWTAPCRLRWPGHARRR